MLSRRSIQTLIDRSAGFLSSEQVKRLVHRLNRNKRCSLDAEWELIILAALATFGSVKHEPDLGGSKRLDVRFRSPWLSFISDVKAVCDEDYDRKNPVDHLARGFARQEKRLRRQGISGWFYFHPEASFAQPKEGRYKTTLILPKNTDTVFASPQFLEFIECIRREPLASRSILLRDVETEVNITWNPGNASWRLSGHPAYNLANDFVHNVVHNALEDKADQIRQAGTRKAGELAGVFLCDGGCGLLRAHRSFNALSVNQVINEFLRTSSTVDFVCVVDVLESSRSGVSVDRSFEVRAWSARHPESATKIRNQLSEALKNLPKPVCSPTNTLNQLLLPFESFKRHYWDFVGGTRSAKTMEVSLRATMEFLAGYIDRAQYEQVIGRTALAWLRRDLESGRGIDEVTIRRNPDKDDDLLVIRLGEADAATSPFKVPNPGPKL